MEEAYQINGLLEELKKEGLEMAEESAKIFIKAMFVWLNKSADMSATPYDDMGKVLYPVIENFALGQADKINPAD